MKRSKNSIFCIKQNSMPQSSQNVIQPRFFSKLKFYIYIQYPINIRNKKNEKILFLFVFPPTVFYSSGASNQIIKSAKFFHVSRRYHIFSTISAISVSVSKNIKTIKTSNLENLQNEPFAKLVCEGHGYIYKAA